MVFARTGATVGKSFLIQENIPEAVFASYLIRIILQNYISKKFIYSFFQSRFYWMQITKGQIGIGQPNVNAKILSNLHIPLPPLNEQHRIVAKLEKLLAKVDACKQRLEKIPTILNRFRQSVLAAACSGRLTADWREQNPNIESAEELLNRIQEERKKKNHKTFKEFLIEKPEEGLIDIPNTWEWVALGNYAECARGRFSIRPRNDPRYYDGQYPFIQIGDLPRNGGTILNHAQTLNEKGLTVSKIFPKGTVAIAIVGATIGNTGILGYEMCFPDSLVGIQTGFEEGNIYLDYYLRSEKEKIRLVSYAGGGQPNIKLETLNPYPFPLPPLEEQQEIVRRVEKLFKKADVIEQRYQKAKEYVDKLTQSILAKAFRGELVPQDPKDEPASVLLERIREERAKQETKTKATKKKKTKTTRKKTPKKKPETISEPEQLNIPGLD